MQVIAASVCCRAPDGPRLTGTTTGVRALPVVTTAARQATTDQFWQGAAFTPSGRLAVSYLDRQYGQDNNLGFSDMTASIADTRGVFTATRATSGPTPPPTQFDGTFMGDYTGIAVSNTTALPLWFDTRPVDLFLCAGTGTPGAPPKTCQAGAANASVANDQDIFTSAVPIR